MESKQDIFDKIMHLPGLNIMEPFYKKNKEVLMYLFFGGIAFFLNLFLFIGIDKALHMNALVNNIICWIICVLFQFFTNRTWVFNSNAVGKKGFLKEITSFFGGRIFTLLVEEVILLIFINLLCFDSTIVKLVAQIIVIVLNYVISKLFVFK